VACSIKCIDLADRSMIKNVTKELESRERKICIRAVYYLLNYIKKYTDLIKISSLYQGMIRKEKAARLQ
jgi:hypothetical protein